MHSCALHRDCAMCCARVLWQCAHMAGGALIVLCLRFNSESDSKSESECATRLIGIGGTHCATDSTGGEEGIGAMRSGNGRSAAAGGGAAENARDGEKGAVSPLFVI